MFIKLDRHHGWILSTLSRNENTNGSLGTQVFSLILEKIKIFLVKFLHFEPAHKFSKEKPESLKQGRIGKFSLTFHILTTPRMSFPCLLHPTINMVTPEDTNIQKFSFIYKFSRQLVKISVMDN
jgi:hypothetical protein